MFDFIKKLFSYEVVDADQETAPPVLEGTAAINTAERPAGAGEQVENPVPADAQSRNRMRPPIKR